MSSIYVYDFLKNNLSDSDAIENAFLYAEKEKIDTIIFDKKDWGLDRAILYFSNLTILVDGVTLKQNADVFDNVFRPKNLLENPDDPYNYPLEIKETENVKILGINGARIEGPEKPSKRLNYCTGEMEETVGDIWGWRTLSVLVTRCKNFELGGLFITKTRNWAVSVERSNNCHFHDIEFLTSCVNGDGINLRNGCHNIKIENIKGTTTDDLIAINNCSNFAQHPRKLWKTYLYPLVPSNFLIPQEEPSDSDIYNVDISNIKLKPVRFVQAVAFLARMGHKIYNISIRNVIEEKNLPSPLHANLIGAYYQDNYGELNESVFIRNIYIDGVTAQNFEYPVLFRENVEGVFVKNVTQNCPTGVVVMAKDEDKIEISDCSSASGIIRTSVDKWQPPY